MTSAARGWPATPQACKAAQPLPLPWLQAGRTHKAGREMPQPDPLRRLLLASLALPLLDGCTAPLTPLDGAATTPEVQALLQAGVRAHGLPALAAINDISVGYDGSFNGLVNRIQPELVDAGFRGPSQDRLLLRDGIAAQASTGASGAKLVLRDAGAGRPGTVRVWYNGAETADNTPRRDAAAIVADCYSLFLLGPMLLAGAWAARPPTLAVFGAERITVAGQDHDCDVLRVRLAPGLGLSEADDLALYLDRAEHLMRRVRFTLNGFEPTRAALAEVDAWGYLPLHGIRWPTRFKERLLRPLPLSVHDWHMTGLDVNRGLDRGTVTGPALTGAAAPPAAPLP